jgi:hypothetical protein
MIWSGLKLNEQIENKSPVSISNSPDNKYHPYLKMADSIAGEDQTSDTGRGEQFLRKIFSPELPSVLNLKRWMLIFAKNRCAAMKRSEPEWI